MQNQIDITNDEKLLSKLLESDPDITIEDALENEMVINMGPQHPATHGVLRLLLRIDGEKIVKCVPELGYLHRGYEKMAENMNYYDYIPHTDRLDYTANLCNNVAYVLAVEKLAGIEVPERATYIRMIINELGRIMGHLVAVGTFALDVGAVTAFMWTFREREFIQNIFDKMIGARFTTSYTRLGGVAADAQEDSFAMIKDFLQRFVDTFDEFERLLNTNRIFVERLDGTGILPKEDAIALGVTGPNLRGSGVEYDIRRAKPYMFYDRMDFEVPVYHECDSLARYFVRVDEIKESVKILYQCMEQIKPGPILANDPKNVLPHKQEIYTKMEELIYDFMLVNFGINPPVGDTYFSVENPKGELGFYFVSNGEGHPWKLKIRSPSFCNIQALPLMVKGQMISDVVAIIGSIDPVMGEADK